MKNISILLLAFLITSATKSVAQINYDESIKDIMKIAAQHIQQKDYQAAIEDFNLAVNKCPDCSEPHYQKALMYADLDQFNKADKELKAGENINPEYAAWYRIILKSKKGFDVEALKDAQYLVEHADNYEWAAYWNRLVNVIKSLKNTQIYPVTNRAAQKYQQKDYLTALNIYDSAIAMCAICNLPHYNKALIYAEMKNLVKADEEFAIAGKMEPKSNQMNYYSIQFKLKKGFIEAAFGDIQKMMDKDTAFHNAFYWCRLKADLELKYRRYADAYKDNCWLYNKNPKNKQVLTAIIIHELYNKMNDKADVHFKEMTLEKGNRDTAEFYSQVSSIYYYKKDYPSALDYINKSISYGKNNGSAMVEKAMLETIINPTGNYLELADKGIEQCPTNPSLWNNRGFTKIIMGHYTDAIVDIKKAIDMNDTEPQPYNNLGYIYYKLGGKENSVLALYNYDKAMELGGKEFDPYWKFKDIINAK